MDINEICPPHIIANQVSNSFMEDMLVFPDWTAKLIPIDKITTANIKTNENMILCGTEWASYAFKLNDANLQINWNFKDGDKIDAGSNLCQITGQARNLLSSERTALNFLQLLSGTATTVSQYVECTKDTKVQIMDTRKTIPGLRLAQKYAVCVGGGTNQRAGLYDGVLIKENHILAHGSIKNVLEAAFRTTPSHISIQIEVETYNELIEALQNGAKLILLDNMAISEIERCVKYTKAHYADVKLEVSGNINLSNVREYALTGIDRISIGKLTKNLQAVDLSLRFI